MGWRIAVASSLVAVIAVAVSGGAMASPGAAGSPAPALTSSYLFENATSNYGFAPDTFANVPTNVSITVEFHDQDVLPHAFVILNREGYQIPRSDTDSELASLIAKYSTLDYGLVEARGDTNLTTFLSPAVPGWYEFVCNVTGHFAMGMYGFIAFGESLPDNLTLPNHASPAGGSNPLGVAILGSGVVVILAVILVLWRRSSSHRRPPAREPR